MVAATKFKFSEAQIDKYSTRFDLLRRYLPADVYCILLMALCGILGLPLLLMQTMFVVPPLLLVGIYSSCIRAPVDHVKRDCSFHLWSFLILTASVPVIGIAVAWVWALKIVRFVLCFPVSLCRCKQARASRDQLAVYGGAPGVFDDKGNGRSPIESLAKEHGAPAPTSPLCLSPLTVPTDFAPARARHPGQQGGCGACMIW
jgi:hypothetical protein